MSLLWLILAGFLEVLFCIFLKLSEGITKPIYIISFCLAAMLSFYCLTKAMQVIPIGTAYAVWTGIGAAGVVVFGMLLFSEPITTYRIFFISTLIASIIGLKLTA
jgi:quaternary ammonium compound-resistance protein SugE